MAAGIRRGRGEPESLPDGLTTALGFPAWANSLRMCVLCAAHRLARMGRGSRSSTTPRSCRCLHSASDPRPRRTCESLAPGRRRYPPPPEGTGEPMRCGARSPAPATRLAQSNAGGDSLLLSMDPRDHPSVALTPGWTRCLNEHFTLRLNPMVLEIVPKKREFEVTLHRKMVGGGAVVARRNLEFPLNQNDLRDPRVSLMDAVRRMFPEPSHRPSHIHRNLVYMTTRL